MKSRRSSKSSRRRAKSDNDTQITRSETVLSMRQGKPYKFVRTFNSGELPILPADQGYATVFLLSALPNFAEFTALFDQYRIEKVSMTFVIDIADGSLNSTTKWPRLTIAPDYNNQSAPSSEDTLLQYPQCQVYQFSEFNREVTVHIKPKVAATVFRTGITSAYTMQTPGWLDVATSDVPHYGLRYFISNHNSASFGSSRVRTYLRFHLGMRNAS